MRVLVVGNGGREHALVWRLAQDSTPPELFCAPGNAGTAAHAMNLPIDAEDLDGLTAWAAENRPDLTVIGPEAPLCAGLADRLEAEGLDVFGPRKDAARLEGSKAFAKDVMTAAGVPTAAYRSFTDAEDAIAYIREQGAPIVVKAEGLAAGKGVTVCATVKEAEAAVRESLVEGVFGDAGGSIVIEECLGGEEASILALVDGDHVVMLASSQDHKRAFNNDEGPNTGGMGAYSPAPVVTDDMWPIIREKIVVPTIEELRRRGIEYRGVLYAGLMIGHEGPKVLEFNCRFGDPETQAVLPRLKSDLLPVLRACPEGMLNDDMLRWHRDPCVCVVMASGGYPGSYAKGKDITGLAEAANMEGVVLLHAGTSETQGRIVTAGGRVLGVTALGPDLPTAAHRAYQAVSKISFDQAQYRTDIAARALHRSG